METSNKFASFLTERNIFTDNYLKQKQIEHFVSGFNFLKLKNSQKFNGLYKMLI